MVPTSQLSFEQHAQANLNIAVIGTGIAGMAAAWLLSKRHKVTVFEQAGRLGGHSNTVMVPSASGPVGIDTGFIVYNEATYPNLTALFEHLGVSTKPSEMSFAVSLDAGRLEYNGTNLKGLFAQPSNAFRPRFWSMLRDLTRFYRNAPVDLDRLGAMSLGNYLEQNRYGAAFRDDHLLPMAAAIWSAPAKALLDYPAQAFIRFCDNHGLLKTTNRPIWRTVEGGSRAYVQRLTAPYAPTIRLNTSVSSLRRQKNEVLVRDQAGNTQSFDHAVIATHADQALTLLEEPDDKERAFLGAFQYAENTAILHTDEALMPRRRRVWASWNYLGMRNSTELCVTYWMNSLQSLKTDRPVFVTLNPPVQPKAGTILKSEVYHHPVFNSTSLAAQQQLWTLQGAQRIWFCGAYFGSGFHEDGLQAGLAVAETLGGVKRPWKVANESGRIVLGNVQANPQLERVAAS